MVPEVPIRVVESYGSFFVNQALMCVEVFSALLGVPLGVPDNLVEYLLQSILGQRKCCCTVG